MEEIKKEDLNNEDKIFSEDMKIDESLEEAEIKEDKEFEEIDEEFEGESIEELKEKNSNILNENNKLSNELETLKERLLRTIAEYDNYRKRTSKEKEGIYTEACSDVLKYMLPVLDNLERAVSAEGSFEDLKKGVEMTLKQFKGSLEKLGVDEISIDKGFDPNYHEAVMHIQDENYGNNEIVEVFQKGYKRADKVIRHSMVKVVN
ncbi:nucleotide exchange factor GrpE [Clostridium sp. HMP27]|uniref:nucleotide exchange factor GrpE n=1 Tax=Clostridium sp. HMP27 TaxID=1487921 RepID=UPI00052BA567|nr:nucleotide exchange factor GrpE [Clostridium sp. HMP27]KGK87972.1 heat shock protein GrpE [Clostridium sp. HMP27]